MHLGLEEFVPLVLYTAAVIALLLSLFWRPQAGLYFLVPLLPLQVIRYKILDLPLGNKLIDVILLGVVLGTAFKGGFHFAKTPMNRLLVCFGIFCYIQLWRGAFFLNGDLPLLPSDPRFSNWKNYMVMFILFAIVVSVIKEVKQIKILVLLMCVSVFVVDKGYYSTMSDRDLTHFSYEVRDGRSLLGYAGVNGVHGHIEKLSSCSFCWVLPLLKCASLSNWLPVSSTAAIVCCFLFRAKPMQELLSVCSCWD